MKQYDDTNRGVLFKREDREEADPVLSGECDVGGKKFWLNVWPAKKSKKGNPYYPVSLKSKGELPAAKTQAEKEEEMDDEIPF